MNIKRELRFDGREMRMIAWPSSRLHPAPGQLGEPIRVVLPGDEGLDHVPRRATSIAATRSITNSCSASGISTGPAATAGFCLCLRRAATSLALQSNPSHYIGWTARGPRSREPKF